MKSSGYIMVDCTGLDLIKGSTPQTISGIYQRVVDAIATGKEMLAVNANWDGTPITPISVFAIQFDGYIIVTSSTLQVVITSSDVITINNMVE